LRVLQLPEIPVQPGAKTLHPFRRADCFLPRFRGRAFGSFFVGPCQSAGSLFQFFRQSQYALDRFPIGYPPREIAVLIGLREKPGDDLFLIHCALHLKQDDGAAKSFKCLLSDGEQLLTGSISPEWN
jgi:hypothetical protein